MSFSTPRRTLEVFPLVVVIVILLSPPHTLAASKYKTLTTSPIP
jgi:hypothetical protein